MKAVQKEPFVETSLAYKCEKGHYTVAIQRTRGLTPMFISCRHTDEETGEECGLDAGNQMNFVPGDVEATHEWYRPGLKQFLTQHEYDHFIQGGLMIRKIGEVTEPDNVPAVSNKKLGRNDVCYCGSGKKYKNCHWKDDN